MLMYMTGPVFPQHKYHTDRRYVKTNFWRCPMSSTNKTPHYDLSQFLAGDKASWIADINPDMLKIDTALFDIKTDATDAASNASAAQQQSQSANENAQLAQQEAEQALTEVTKLQTKVSAIETDYTGLSGQVNTIQSSLNVAESDITELQTDVQTAQTTANAAQSAASSNTAKITPIQNKLNALSLGVGNTSTTTTDYYTEVIAISSDLNDFSVGKMKLTTVRSSGITHVNLMFSITLNAGPHNYIDFYTEAFRVNQIGSTSLNTRFFNFTTGSVTDGIPLSPPTSNTTAKRFTFNTPLQGPGIFYGTISFQKTS